MNQHYTSGALNYVSNKVLKFSNWVPPRGPTGLRNVIDRIELRANYDLTVATAVMQGENLPELFARIDLADTGGGRRLCPGRALRLANYRMMEARNIHEFADIAVGANKTGTYILDLPLVNDHAEFPEDACLPAELLKYLHITCPTAASLSLGTSVVTVNSISYELVAFCHEEESVRVFARSYLGEETMETTTQGNIDVGGGFMFWALGYKAGDALADMTNWVGHRIIGLQPEVRTIADKQHEYMRDYGVGSNGTTPGANIYNDPHLLAAPKCVVIWATSGKRPRIKDHAFVEKFRIEAPDNTIDDVTVLTYSRLPKNESEVAKVKRAYRVGATEAARGKVDANLARFLPEKAVR